MRPHADRTEPDRRSDALDGIWSWPPRAGYLRLPGSHRLPRLRVSLWRIGRRSHTWARDQRLGGGEDLRLHGNVEKRLSDTRTELARLREGLRILDEQAAYQADVAQEAETRAIVAGTPLADRQLHEAAEDLRRLRRQGDEAREQIAAVAAEQDQLLERLFDAKASP